MTSANPTGTAPDSVRRAPLRAADWRFLLPRPPADRFHLLVVRGAPSGLAQRLIEIGLAQQVSESLPKADSADAVATLGGARVDLREIAGCLAPGGVLYYELERRALDRLPWGVAALHRSLREVGLSPTGTYAVVPDFSEPRMYLPLDAAGAFRWYVETLHTAVGPWQRFLEIAARVVTGLDGRRLAHLVVRVAVTAVRKPERSSVPSVLDLPDLPPELRRPGLRPLLLTPGGDRVVILPFARDEAQPAAVLKVPRHPGFNSRTEHEHAAMRTLWSHLDPVLRRSIPRALGIFRHDDVTVGIESYLPGQRLSRSVERWGASRQGRLDDLQMAAAWLSEFHLQAQVCRGSWGASELSQWVTGPFEAYRADFGITEAERLLFAAASEYAGTLAGTPLPIVTRHRDFTIWNVARSARGLAVFDWEGSRAGPALCDLLHFVTHWYEAVHHAYDEPARQHTFRRLLCEPERRDRFAAAAHQAIAQYLRRLDMDPSLLPLLTVYTWVELALRRRDQQRLQEDGITNPREENRYLGIVAILAAHRQRLFDQDAPWMGRLRSA